LKALSERDLHRTNLMVTTGDFGAQGLEGESGSQPSQEITAECLKTVIYGNPLLKAVICGNV